MLMLAVLALLTGLVVRHADAATISGTVVDASGAPVADARVDHAGGTVVVSWTSLGIKPSPDEPRTDDHGHFRVRTMSSAIVVRKPGYISQRVLINGDAQIQLTLQEIKTESRCKLANLPKVRTKKIGDVDFTATWYYIKTKEGRRGVLSGSGGAYTLGAPNETDVQTSTEYSEMMYQSGVIDAAGRSADGTYWRSRSIFTAAANYRRVDRETADQLDCVLDLITLRTN